MGVGTSIAVPLIGAGIGAGSSMAAASTQAGAAKTAAELQAQEQEQALQFQEQEWNQQQANEAPWLKAGGGAVTTLSDLMNNGAFAPWTSTFTAPTAEEAAKYPGYQFQLEQGEKALQNSAAASGGLLTGNTGEALQQYGQGLAQTDYNNVYNQALQQYQMGYNQYQQNQANLFNRYAALAGLGQTSAGQLGSEGASAAGNIGNISLTGGAQIGQQLNNAAAATASGYVGAGNAFSSAFGNLGQYATLQQILKALNQNNGLLTTSSNIGSLPLGTNPYAGADYGLQS